MKRKLGLLSEEEMERLRYLEQKYKMMQEVSGIDDEQVSNHEENEENILR